MTNQITIHSPAKVNWLLRVSQLRPDGYHDLCSVMQNLAIGDVITVTRRNDSDCSLSGFPSDIRPDKNLAFMAWKAMREAFSSHVSGVDIAIKKQLPQGGGLGGGSSNAASVILALVQLFQIVLPAPNDTCEHLRSIAATIGSDIPFFIPGGAAIVTGRGEKVQLLSPAPSFHLVLIFPDQGMSTPSAYRQLDAVVDRNTALPSSHELDNFTQTLRAADAASLAQIIENDFELVSAQYDWFLDARQKLEQAGVLRAFLCGSGSTVAGLCADKESALRIASEIGGIYTYSVSTRPAAR